MGQILQTAASAYRMVLHEATGMYLFLMLYGRESLLPEEIEHTRYGSNVNYEKAVAGHREDAGHPRLGIGKERRLY